jgi:fermentation-respiration switch protein FrsA (DUF1100 family)
MRSPLLRTAGKLTLAAVAAVLMLRWFEHRNVYLPSRALDATGAELGRPFEELTLTTTDGERLHAWFFPAGANSPRAAWAILHCHGNGGNISHRLEHAQAMLETGASVLLFDYRGYGRSTGTPSEEGTYRDAQAAYQWLRQKGFAADRIVVVGESLGGGVAAELARRETVGGLVLQSAFTSIPDVGAELFPWLPVRWLARIRYDTLARLPQLRVPVLVMHGRGDTIIRHHHGERLFAAANEPKLFVELHGDHNDTMDEGRDGFVAGLKRFFEMLERTPSRP